MSKIADVETARAIIAHEAEDCFIGAEESTTKQPKTLVSCIGGAFWGRPGEEWPRSAKRDPLFPWLQIVCTEMKNLYGGFHRRRAVCFYLDQDFSGWEAVAKWDDSEFVVRDYSLGEELVPVRRPAGLERHKFHRIRWRKVPDYPSISKYYELFDDAVYSSLCADKRFKFRNRSGIKVGGWPTPIQVAQRYPGTFELQIDLTANYMYADSGIAYLSSRSGTWHAMFETI